MSSAGWLLVLVTAGVAACSTDTDNSGRTEPPRSENAPLRAPKTGDRLVPARVPFATASGTRVFDVKVDETGHVWMGDTGFGSIDDLAPRAAGRKGLEWRWPHGTVNYVYQTNKGDLYRDINVGDPLRTTIRTAMDYIEARIPRVKFVEYASVDDAPDEYVKIRKNGQGTGTSRSDVGLQHNLISEQTTDFGEDAPNAIIIHELGHLLGLRHEQERPDRDQFIDVCADNATESDPFATLSYGETDLLTPYQHTSIMHYRPDLFLVANPTMSRCNGLTMKVKAGIVDTVPDEPGAQLNLGSGGNYTLHDINALVLQYSGRAGNPEKGDMLGSSIAIGDFDGDGYADVAIGGPGEKPGNGDQDVGIIYVFKGTEYGPVPWMNLDAPGAGEHAMLGMSLVAADFDGDGIVDLAAGMPFRKVNGVVSGMVRVWHGGRFEGARFVTSCPSGSVCAGTPNPPLSPWVELSVRHVSGETPGTNDGFGARLAAGDLNGDGFAELIVGAPGRANNSGRVFVFRGESFNSTIVASMISASPFASGVVNGAQFGEALAVGNFDGDGFRDLAVGAPGAGKGKVYTFRGRSSNATPLEHLQIDPPSSTSSDARFGASLASGKVTGTLANVVVGATRQLNSYGFKAGGVYVYALDGPSSSSFSLKELEISSKKEEEYFGAAVAVLDENGDGRADIAVGAPLHNIGQGRVVVFRSDGMQVTQKWELLPNGYAGGFGTTLAVGQVHHPNAWQRTVPLIVGAPYTDDADTINIGATYGWGFNPSTAFESFTLFQNSHSQFSISE